MIGKTRKLFFKAIRTPIRTDILPRYSKEGDANSNDLPSHSLRLLEIHYLFSFHLLIESPSCEILTTTAMVDNIATTNKTNIVTSGIHKSCLSDHYLLGNFVVLAKKQPKNISTWQTKNFDQTEIVNDHLGVDWRSIVRNTDDTNTTRPTQGGFVAPPHSV